MLVYIIYKYICMSHQIFHLFHLSQATVLGGEKQPRHHRPLMLLLILIIVSQQFGIFLSFADSLSGTPGYITPPKTYIYVRTNPIIDDSWIGTLVSFTKKLPIVTSLSGSIQDISTLEFNSANIIRNSNSAWNQEWKDSLNIIN